MRLFVSYARVDKRYCEQIVDTLDVHDIWYDQRLHAGQEWWEEIERRIRWCEGFVYLLSPDSVSSEYCWKEFLIAKDLGKHIFPVLIHPRTVMPAELKTIQYADLCKGLTVDAVKFLLNSVYISEREGRRTLVPVAFAGEVGVGVATLDAVTTVSPPSVNTHTVIDDAAEAMEVGNYDRAVFLLKQAKEQGFESNFVNIDALLEQAEAALERQAYLRDAKREYAPIFSLVKRKRTRELGCRAFQQFRTQFPDYDPKDVGGICSTLVMALLEWCEVPEGDTTIEYSGRNITYFVEPFRIGKYPVTNTQYQTFVDAKDGYADEKWWDFSTGALEWRKAHPEPLKPKFSMGDHPRANVCWFEARAFCRWLSAKTGLQIELPTEQQWQRAAQGDDELNYPWGNKFTKTKCNTRESKLKMTTAVSRYKSGLSVYGAHDMAGNVWEWCRNTEYGKQQQKGKNASLPPRAVRGGSFISVPQRARTTFHFYLNPAYRYATIGFRLAVAGKADESKSD